MTPSQPTTPSAVLEATALTPRQQQTLAALSLDWRSAGRIAAIAKYGTQSDREAASKYADQLVRLGLAEKYGSRMFPSWRLSALAAQSTGEKENEG